ncbi:MAG: NAD(P)-dependent glycerol-3-phosphate dehydrogenase [Alicyclobacillaceae bacterium]|nr:NAD(P)-dependent glycerol-3-phosphate dehydrogenase [Alicyclobacillaceae bacterium]
MSTGEPHLPAHSVGVVGAGSWGTALAHVLASNGHRVRLWSRQRSIVEDINEHHSNARYLPGALLHSGVYATMSIEECLESAHWIFLCVPSTAISEIVESIRPYVSDETNICHAIKGFAPDEQVVLSAFLHKRLGVPRRITVIGGPSHAEEVIREQPTTLVVSGYSQAVVETLQDVLMTPFTRVYTNPDRVGVEVGGALKNVIALSVGVASGLGFGDNAKAALMTRGLAELTRLGVALGASPMTFSGLAGVGDLIVTCTSEHSRNFRAGRLIGQGFTLDEAIQKLGMVVEGAKATKRALELGAEHDIKLPIAEAMGEVLFENANPRDIVRKLMERGKTGELEDVAATPTIGSWFEK